jgi:hypothetical protein
MISIINRKYNNQRIDTVKGFDIVLIKHRITSQLCKTLKKYLIVVVILSRLILDRS